MADLEWKTMDSAPRDGSAFLVQYLPYSHAVLCMRKVRYKIGESGIATPEDCGAWLHVHDIDDDCEHGPTDCRPLWSVAPDGLNKTSAWRWSELPQAPKEILDDIRRDLGWSRADDAATPKVGLRLYAD